MRALCPKGEEESNIFRYEFFFRLPPNIQAMLGEDDSSSAIELAARAVKSAPTINAVEEDGEIAVVHQDNSKKRKRDSKPRKDRNAGDAGGGGAPKGGPKPWEQLGLCYAHYTWGTKARNCRPGCARAEN
jgi:hypothetical protein